MRHDGTHQALSRSDALELEAMRTFRALRELGRSSFELAAVYEIRVNNAGLTGGAIVTHSDVREDRQALAELCASVVRQVQAVEGLAARTALQAPGGVA